jgi:hypothetical protein
VVYLPAEGKKIQLLETRGQGYQYYEEWRDLDLDFEGWKVASCGMIIKAGSLKNATFGHIVGGMNALKPCL